MNNDGWWWYELFYKDSRFLLNGMFLVSAICLLLVWYKLFATRDGKLRHALLIHFGAAICGCLFWAILYHPFFQEWVFPLGFFPYFLSVVNLTYYFLRYGGIGGKHD